MIGLTATLLNNTMIAKAGELDLLDTTPTMVVNEFYKTRMLDFTIEQNEEPIEEETVEETEPEIEVYITNSPYFNYKGKLNTEYRQTYYSVEEENEKQLGSGLNHRSDEVKSINNIMHYNDVDYGWIPIYAVNMEVVTNSGQNNRGIWNIYGSVIEVTKDEETWYGYVGDACGACRTAKKIDLWVENDDQSLDVDDISFRFVRYGHEEYLNGDENSENR